MKDFRRLTTWQKSYRVALEVYRATAAFPVSARFGLTSQMRRAAVSAPSNIAEGCGRSGDGEMARYLSLAMGSASELECQLLLAHDLGMLADGGFESLQAAITELRRMLNGLTAKVAADRRVRS
ncbi:MAG: four helix bundle protein [Terriglobales bacterium]